MTPKTLHVTTGDAIASLWKKAGVVGTYLAWRDPLFEGPVPAGLSHRALSAVRIRYLGFVGHGNPIRIQRDFEQRDTVFERAASFEEIVLWFEHDLFDQLHLLQILETMRELRIPLERVSLVQSGEYLGMMQPDELAALGRKRRNIPPSIAEAATGAWHAFTGDDPHALAAAAQRTYLGLPFLAAALGRLCEEYPAVTDGLSRTQRQILAVIGAGALTRAEIFARTQAREEAPFQGDASIDLEVRSLCADDSALLDSADDRYRVTVFGHRVLSGDADRYEHPVPERWIGGVRIDESRPWRWDESRRAFASPAAVVEP